MKKVAFSILGALFVVFCILGTLHFYYRHNSPDEQIQKINLEINNYTKEIKQERQAALNAQIEATQLMRIEWDAYLKKVKEVDEHEEKIHSLEKQVQTLKQERDLIKQSKTT